MKRFDLRRYTHEKHQVGLFRQNNNDIDGRVRSTWVSVQVIIIGVSVS
jgi:hypothetical protein